MRTQDADHKAEIQALSAFLASGPEQWPELVPQMVDAVGVARLGEIVQTARRRVGSFDSVTDSPEGLMITGYHAQVLAWVRLNEGGELIDGNLKHYLAYGQKVYSPCAGTVIAAVDGLADQVPGAARFAPTDGNHVLIDTGTEILRLAHLRDGSILVHPGEPVQTGQLLGEVGNSGCSNQPHLTIAATRGEKKLDLIVTGIEGTLYTGRTVEA